MLANLLRFLTPSRYDSFVLLIVSHGGINCVHLVPEEQGSVEHVNVYTGSDKHPPSLPSTVVSIGPRETLGVLEVKVAEGESLLDAVLLLGKYVEEAYKADSATPRSDTDGFESRLNQCEHVLREGFHTMVEERRGKHGASAAKYMVELARISRSRPGRIWDCSMLTSLPD